MKKSIKKVLSIIMALCLFIGILPITVLAKDEQPDGYVEVESVDVIQFSPEVQLEAQNIVNDNFEANKFYGSDSSADDAYLFYDQLTAAQKVIYSEFLAAGVAEMFLMSNTSYTTRGATVSDAVNTAKSRIANDLMRALTAAAEDNPFYFWVNGFGYGFSYYQQQTSTGYEITAVEIEVSIRIDGNSYTDYSDVEAKLLQLAQAVQAAPINGITRYEKVKSIHDYICSINEYPDPQGTFSDGSTWYGPMAHEPTGVFLKGLAVCEGYAEAFKLLCDREGVPCITVLGTGDGGAHKWNYVKMEDNKWYLVDATWNDQTAYVFNDYLLCGTDTMTPFFDPERPDSEVHVPIGTMYTGATPLQYPVLQKDSYGKIILRYNPGDITIEDSMNVIFVGKDITSLQSKFVMPSNFSASITSYTDLTGGQITVTKDGESTSKTYVFAKRGDIDGSNTTNTTDYNKVVSAASAGSCPANNTAEYYAGDINHDGAIDGFDAVTLDLYLSGDIDFD